MHRKQLHIHTSKFIRSSTVVIVYSRLFYAGNDVEYTYVRAAPLSVVDETTKFRGAVAGPTRTAQISICPMLSLVV